MTAPAPEHDALGRARLTNTKRIELLERDRDQQSRTITEMINKGQGFSEQQLAQLRTLLMDVLGDGGLRLEGTEAQDEARKDFMFLRWLRTFLNGTAAKIGWLVIAAFVGGIIWLVNTGLNTWRG